MAAVVLDGRGRAADLTQKLKNHIAALSAKTGRVPGLAVIRVGDDAASQVYVTTKCRACDGVGIVSFSHVLPESSTENEILTLIHQLNVNPDVHGILLQLPLPFGVSADRLIGALAPEKDVDGLHPQNMGRLMMGDPLFMPCTPKGCLDLLKTHHKNLNGMHAVILGRSILVGRPLGMALLLENMTVTMVHSKSRDVAAECRRADVVIAAIGKPRFVTVDFIKDGATVLDVGINRLLDNDGNGYLVGDVDFQAVSQKAGAISPVPGGIGPMTVVSLLQNTVIAFERQIGF